MLAARIAPCEVAPPRAVQTAMMRPAVRLDEIGRPELVDQQDGVGGRLGRERAIAGLREKSENSMLDIAKVGRSLGEQWIRKAAQDRGVAFDGRLPCPRSTAPEIDGVMGSLEDLGIAEERKMNFQDGRLRPIGRRAVESAFEIAANGDDGVCQRLAFLGDPGADFRDRLFSSNRREGVPLHETGDRCSPLQEHFLIGREGRPYDGKLRRVADRRRAGNRGVRVGPGFRGRPRVPPR